MTIVHEHVDKSALVRERTPKYGEWIKRGNQTRGRRNHMIHLNMFSLRRCPLSQRIVVTLVR